MYFFWKIDAKFYPVNRSPLNEPYGGHSLFFAVKQFRSGRDISFCSSCFFFFGVCHCVLFYFCAEPKQNKRERHIEKGGFRIFWDMWSLFSWCVCVLCVVCFFSVKISFFIRSKREEAIPAFPSTARLAQLVERQPFKLVVMGVS